MLGAVHVVARYHEIFVAVLMHDQLQAVWPVVGTCCWFGGVGHACLCSCRCPAVVYRVWVCHGGPAGQPTVGAQYFKDGWVWMCPWHL